MAARHEDSNRRGNQSGRRADSGTDSTVDRSADSGAEKRGSTDGEGIIPLCGGAMIFNQRGLERQLLTVSDGDFANL